MLRTRAATSSLRHLTALGLWFAVACGGTKHAARTEPAPTSTTVESFKAGSSVAVRRPTPGVARPGPAPPSPPVEPLNAGSGVAVRRPTPGVARLSLWLDVGARDAEPPQLALAAALWAAQKPELEARVLSDGTELSLLCDTEGERIAGCVRRVTSALTNAAPGPAELTRVRDKLRSMRNRARGVAQREVESLALQALLGDAAHALDPFGDEADDEKLDARALQEFVKRHYARDRSLLVGVGDVSQRELASQLDAQHVPLHGSARVAAGKLTARDGLRVELGEANRIALALPMGSVAQAASFCDRFRSIHPEATASVSALRGATLVVLSLPGGTSMFARLQSALFDARRALIERSDRPPLPPPDSLDALDRRLGETWLARGRSASTTSASAPIGVAVIAARELRPADKGDEAALAKVRELAAKAVALAEQNSSGETSGDVTENMRAVRSENGARIDVVQRAGDAWFSAAIRMQGGSEDDPPTTHGRAALLASLMADGCGFSAGRSLDVWLRSIDARLAPLVDAQGVGVVVTAPNAHTLEALDTMLRCALRPAIAERAVDDARARVVRSLWNDAHAKYEAMLARAILPMAPGMVAPRGSPDGIAKVDSAELRRMHGERSKGGRVHVWVTSDLPPEEVSRFVARRVAHLPRGEAYTPRNVDGPPSEINGNLGDDAALRVVIGVRSSQAAHPMAGRVFAHLFGEALGKRVGTLLWDSGKSTRAWSFAGVALALREDEVEALRDHVKDALRDVAARPDASLRQALLQSSLPLRAQLSDARGWAEASFHGEADAKLDAKSALAVMRKMAAETPVFFFSRPRP